MKLLDKKSYRRFKIANMIKLALIDIFQLGKMLDPRLFDYKITITKVIAAPKASEIYHCYILPFGHSKLSEEEFMDAISQSLVKIRVMVTKKINLKYSPELKFYYDYSFDNVDKIGKILNSLKD